MELSRYIFPLRKWWWLLVASTLIAAILSYLDTLRQPAVYQARTTIMIGTTINDPNPSSNEFLLGQQLAAAYADIANREIVRTATMNALGMNRLPDYIARPIPNTQLIEIVVTDIDPERPKIIANELATQLILMSPTSAQPDEQERQEFINEQLNNLEAQIKKTEDEINDLQAELGNMISARQIDDTENKINSLQSKLSSMQANYGTLLANTRTGAINTLTVIEPAGRVTNPLGPRKGLNILLAAFLGFVLAACEAYLLEYLDDSLKVAGDVSRMFSAPIIGHIFEHDGGKDVNRLIDTANARDPIAEAYRTLRTKIEFAGVNQRLKTILVTSADVGDGKTSVAANLALSIARKEKKVVLLDGDLRRPGVHQLFNLSNQQGWVDLFMGSAATGNGIGIKKDGNVIVLTAGKTPPNPTELLSSNKMDRLLSMLEEFADVVIIDGPPFVVADAMILASKVDGVLIVVRPGHTRRSLARVAIEQLELVGARVVGVVLNRIPLRGADYYAGRSYLYTYYLSDYGVEHEEVKN